MSESCCYDHSEKRRAQRAAWEKTPKAKRRQKAYRRRLRKAALEAEKKSAEST